MDYIEVGDFDEMITTHNMRVQYYKYCNEHNIKKVGNKAIKYIIENEYGGTKEYKTVNKNQTNVWSGIRFKNNNISDNEQNKQDEQNDIEL